METTDNNNQNDYLPFLHDMLEAGVPETTAKRWHNAIWLLKSHTENLIDIIDDESDMCPMLQCAAGNARIALRALQRGR